MKCTNVRCVCLGEKKMDAILGDLGVNTCTERLTCRGACSRLHPFSAPAFIDPPSRPLRHRVSHPRGTPCFWDSACRTHRHLQPCQPPASHPLFRCRLLGWPKLAQTLGKEQAKNLEMRKSMVAPTPSYWSHNASDLSPCREYLKNLLRVLVNSGGIVVGWEGMMGDGWWGGAMWARGQW